SPNFCDRAWSALLPKERVRLLRGDIRCRQENGAASVNDHHLKTRRCQESKDVASSLSLEHCLLLLAPSEILHNCANACARPTIGRYHENFAMIPSCLP